MLNFSDGYDDHSNRNIKIMKHTSIIKLEQNILYIALNRLTTDVKIQFSNFY